jgi:hypothetical protein
MADQFEPIEIKIRIDGVDEAQYDFRACRRRLRIPEMLCH